MSEKFVRYVTGIPEIAKGRRAVAMTQVLLTLAKKADDRGVVSMSKNEIRMETGITPSRVIRVLGQLVDSGHLKLLEYGGREGRNHGPNVWQIVVNPPEPLVVDGQEQLELPETKAIDREYLDAAISDELEGLSDDEYAAVTGQGEDG